MASYNVVWKRSAEKELRKLPREHIQRLVLLAQSLQEDPFPSGICKLAGADYTYRVRSGDYRLIYTVENNQLIIEIIRVGHRKDVYR